MFNEEIKLRYVEEKSKETIVPQNYLKCQFNKVSKMEFELNKDISNFALCEIIEYYRMLNVTSLESLIVMNSYFSMYTQWCLKKELAKNNQNHFLEMSLQRIKDCINKDLADLRIVSRENVLNWVGQLPNPKDQFVLLGLFEGLKGKNFCELSRLKPEDILGNTAYLPTGRTKQISNDLIKIIKDCLTEGKYYSISGKGVKTMPLVYKGYIIKDYPNTKNDVSDFQVGRKIYNNITRVLKYFDMLDFMSANTIMESGKIYMIKERAKELGMSNKDYIYSEYIKEVEDKYNFTMVRSIFWLKYKEYLL